MVRPRKLKKSQGLGLGGIYLHEKPLNVPHQEWIGFKKKDRNVKCQVRIEVIVKKKKNPEIIHVRLPRLLFVLEKTKHLAGESVRGALILNIGTKLAFKYLRVSKN